MFVKEGKSYELSPFDSHIVSVIARKPMTADEYAKSTGKSRATVYHHFNELAAKGVLRKKGALYYYVDPPVSLKLTPIIGFIGVVAVMYALVTANAGVAFFSFLYFLAAYLVESLEKR